MGLPPFGEWRQSFHTGSDATQARHAAGRRPNVGPDTRLTRRTGQSPPTLRAERVLVLQRRPKRPCRSGASGLRVALVSKGRSLGVLSGVTGCKRPATSLAPWRQGETCAPRGRSAGSRRLSSVIRYTRDRMRARHQRSVSSGPQSLHRARDSRACCRFGSSETRGDEQSRPNRPISRTQAPAPPRGVLHARRASGHPDEMGACPWARGPFSIRALGDARFLVRRPLYLPARALRIRVASCLASMWIPRAWTT